MCRLPCAALSSTDRLRVSATWPLSLLLVPDLLLLLLAALPLNLLLLPLLACRCSSDVRTVRQTTPCNEIRALHASAAVAGNAAAAAGASLGKLAAAAVAAV